MVRIRLKKLGRKGLPVFRLVAMDSRAKRDGKSVEILGTYDPLAPKDKQIVMERERVQYWLSVGAQPSDTAANLIKKAGIGAK